eukprot:g79808.t1
MIQIAPTQVGECVTQESVCADVAAHVVLRVDVDVDVDVVVSVGAAGLYPVVVRFEKENYAGSFTCQYAEDELASAGPEIIRQLRERHT